MSNFSKSDIQIATLAILIKKRKIFVLLEHLFTLSGHEKNGILAKITALMTNLVHENHGLAEKVADHLQSSDTPGMPWCNLHTCLAWDCHLTGLHEALEGESPKKEEKVQRNDVMLIKEGRFGRQCPALLKCIDILDSAQEYLRVDSKCQNEVSRLLRSLLPCPLVHFEWTVEVLVGYHMMEPFLGILFDLQPRPTYNFE